MKRRTESGTVIQATENQESLFPQNMQLSDPMQHFSELTVSSDPAQKVQN